MLPKYGFSKIDQLLRSIADLNPLSDCKVMVLEGDFPQSLSVPPGAIKNGLYLNQMMFIICFKIYFLDKNMRVNSEQ